MSEEIYFVSLDPLGDANHIYPKLSVIDSKAMKQVLPDQGPYMRIKVIAIKMQEKLVQKKDSI